MSGPGETGAANGHLDLACSRVPALKDRDGERCGTTRTGQTVQQATAPDNETDCPPSLQVSPGSVCQIPNSIFRLPREAATDDRHDTARRDDPCPAPLRDGLRARPGTDSGRREQPGAGLPRRRRHARLRRPRGWRPIHRPRRQRLPRLRPLLGTDDPRSRASGSHRGPSSRQPGTGPASAPRRSAKRRWPSGSSGWFPASSRSGSSPPGPRRR